MKPAIAFAFCLFVFATLPPLSSAKSVPLEAPNPGCGVIGVTLKIIPPAKLGSRACDTVFFVKIGDDGDRFASPSVLRSNHAKGKHVYLLNAQPGRYVAVAAGDKITAPPTAGPPSAGLSVTISGSGRMTAFLSSQAIAQTEVTVESGHLSFMGEIEVATSTKVAEADAAQSHYLHLLLPEDAHRGFMTRAFAGSYDYIGAIKSLARDAAAENKFWSAAVRDFNADEAWSRRIQQGMQAAGAAPVPPPSDPAKR